MHLCMSFVMFSSRDDAFNRDLEALPEAAKPADLETEPEESAETISDRFELRGGLLIVS